VGQQVRGEGKRPGDSAKFGIVRWGVVDGLRLAFHANAGGRQFMARTVSISHMSQKKMTSGLSSSMDNESPLMMQLPWVTRSSKRIEFSVFSFQLPKTIS
jgi:hypothetical protein